MAYCGRRQEKVRSQSQRWKSFKRKTRADGRQTQNLPNSSSASPRSGKTSSVLRLIRGGSPESGPTTPSTQHRQPAKAPSTWHHPSSSILLRLSTISHTPCPPSLLHHPHLPSFSRHQALPVSRSRRAAPNHQGPKHRRQAPVYTPGVPAAPGLCCWPRTRSSLALAPTLSLTTPDRGSRPHLVPRQRRRHQLASRYQEILSGLISWPSPATPPRLHLALVPSRPRASCHLHPRFQPPQASQAGTIWRSHCGAAHRGIHTPGRPLPNLDLLAKGLIRMKDPVFRTNSPHINPRFKGSRSQNKAAGPDLRKSELVFVLFFPSFKAIEMPQHLPSLPLLSLTRRELRQTIILRLSDSSVILTLYSYSDFQQR